jgi:two-component system phosphate regulon sensor histidine kinase PhoR
MIEGVIAVDNDERIISVNVAGAHMLGVTESDARGKYVQEVLRLPELQRFISRTLKAKGMQEAQFDLQERLERIVQGHGTPLLSSDGSGMGAVIVLHDITHILRLEGVRRDFVANVSHELRTPITSIKGFVETLRDGALDSPDDSRRFLEIIARQTDHLNSIINDLLTLSQLEQPERDQIGMSPTNVKSVLEHAISTCQHRARKQDVALKLKSGDSIVVTANPSLLEQAVVNLIDNAIKYSPSGSAVDVTATSTGSLVTIAVIDRGSGIERAHLSRLFERFYRVDIARSRELGGTGLGLAIVKHIVSAHNGTVVVDSAPGKGSTFTISLPQT